MTTIPFTNGAGEAISLAGSGGNDNAVIVDDTFFSSADTITGATGSSNTIYYSGTTSWSIILDASFSGISGIEAIDISAGQTVNISFTDPFIANNNDGGDFYFYGNAATSVYMNASSLTTYSIIVEDSAGPDTIFTGGNNDEILLGSGADSVSANAGDDIFLATGTSAISGDTLIGGLGTDLFSFTVSGSIDLTATQISLIEEFDATTDGATLIFNTSQLSGITSFSMVAGGADDIVALMAGGTADFSGISLSGVDLIRNGDNSALAVTLPGLIGYEGGTGADNITGSTNADVVFLGDGNDSFSGLGGNDTLLYDGQNELTGDSINGGAGTDNISLSNNGIFDLTLVGSITGIENVDAAVDGTTIKLSNTLAAGFQSISAQAGGAVDRLEIIGGGSANLTSLSISGFDVIANGDNAILTIALPNTGNLQYQGGSSAENITGGTGQESIFAGSGNDTLDGQLGNDVLIGGAGADSVQGGDGNDLIFGGTDTLAASDTISGGLGNDTIDAGDGADSVTGGDGDDLIFAGSAGVGHADVLYGDVGNDTLIGNQSAVGATDLLVGGLGDDVIFGGLGADTLQGVDGNDTILGGNGADSILAGLGNDVLWGDGGVDYFAFLPLDGIDTLADFVHGEDLIDLTSRSFGSYATFLTATTQTIEANGLSIGFSDGAQIRLYGITSISATDFLF